MTNSQPQHIPMAAFRLHSSTVLGHALSRNPYPQLTYAILASNTEERLLEYVCIMEFFITRPLL